MKQRTVRILLVLALVSSMTLWLFIHPRPVLADNCSTVDFKTTDGGFSAYHSGADSTPDSYRGVWDAGVGWRTGGAVVSGSHAYRGVYIVSPTYSGTIISVSIIVSWQSANHESGYSAAYGIYNYYGGYSLYAANPITSGTSGTNETVTGTGTAGSTQVLLVDNPGESADTSDPGGDAQITSMTICTTTSNPFPTQTSTTPPTATIPVGPTITPGPSPTPIPSSVWVYPISLADGRTGVNEAVGDVPGMFYASEPNAMAVMSGKTIASDGVGVMIHSMTDGSVTQLDPVGQCIDTKTLDSQFEILSFFGKCYLRGSSSFSIPALWVFPTLTAYDFEVGLGLDNVWKLVITADSGAKITYLVYSPQVEVGQTVNKGCELGTATQYYTDPNNPNRPTGSLALVSTIDASGHPLDAISTLGAEPPNVQCGHNTDKSHTCKLLTNPTFTSSDNASADGWIAGNTGTGNAPGFPGHGVVLAGSISQSNLTLDPTHSYIITIIGRTISFNASGLLTVQLGQGSSQVTLTPAVETQVIASATYTPTIAASDYGSGGANLYTFTLTTPPDLSMLIEFACVADAADSLPVDSTGCILFNNNFGDSSAWTAASGASLSSGYATLPDTGTLTQSSITLNPATGGAQSYVITVTGRTTASGATVTLTYTFGSHTLALYPNLDSPTGDNQTSATVLISTAETHDFELSASATGGSAYVSRVCITTPDGSTPPGYQNPGVLIGQCRVVMYAPVGDLVIDTPNLFLWMYGNILNIWTCEAQPILYGIWTVLVNFLTVFGFFRLWLALFFYNLGALLNGNLAVFARWGNGQILNATSALQDAISYSRGAGYQVFSTGANFWDVLLALFNNIGGIFTSGFTFLGTAVTSIRDVLLSLIALISMVITIFGSIILLLLTNLIQWIDGLITFLGVVLQALLIALNSPAIVPTGLTICDMNADLIPQECLYVFWLDNTIFAPGSIVSMVLPYVEGIGALFTIWWAINCFKRTLSGGSDA